MPEFPRTPRLDAGLLLRELAEATGVRLAEDGACRGGQVGAAYVRWPDGHRSVLTSLPPDFAAAVRRSESMLAAGRARGVPAPRYELVAELPGAVAIVQELLPGSPPGDVSRRTVESMVELNQRCRGVLADRADLPDPSLYLRADGPGFCLHEPLARYDRRTARLLASVEEIGAAVPEQLTGEDLVHFDFHPENVLIDAAGTVTGVVDWDGAGRSNGYLDLFTLRFDLALRAPELGRWLEGLLRSDSRHGDSRPGDPRHGDSRHGDSRPGDPPPGAAQDEVIQACWAHLSLRLVDWSIRHLSASHVTSWLGIAEALRP